MFSLDNVIDLRTWSYKNLTFIRLPELATPTSKGKITRLSECFQNMPLKIQQGTYRDLCKIYARNNLFQQECFTIISQ